MAPKRRLRSNTSASSGDDTSAFQVVQRPTKSPLAPVSADQESVGSDGDEERGAGDEIYSSDEIGENGALIKRPPPPKRIVVAKIPMKNVKSPETSPLKRKAAKSAPRKKTGKAAAPPGPPRLTRNAAAAQLARSPSPEKAATTAASGAAKLPTLKKAVASEAAKSPTPKSGVAATMEAANSPQPGKAAARTEIAGTPPPTRQADETMNVTPSPEAEAPAGEETLPQVQEDEYDAEKHFKEKSQTYWYLWQMMLTLEAEHFLSFKGAFLKIDDTKASTLNTKIKKLYVHQLKQQLSWMVVEKDVTKVLVGLIE